MKFSICSLLVIGLCFAVIFLDVADGRRRRKYQREESDESEESEESDESEEYRPRGHHREHAHRGRGRYSNKVHEDGRSVLGAVGDTVSNLLVGLVGTNRESAAPYGYGAPPGGYGAPPPYSPYGYAYGYQGSQGRSMFGTLGETVSGWGSSLMGAMPSTSEGLEYIRNGYNRVNGWVGNLMGSNDKVATPELPVTTPPPSATPSSIFTTTVSNGSDGLSDWMVSLLGTNDQVTTTTENSITKWFK